MKSLFGFCHRMQYLPSNPAAELAAAGYENRLAERILPEEDLQRVLVGRSAPRDRVLLNSLYQRACAFPRPAGCGGATSPRGEAGQITVFGKGGRTRAVALPRVWKELNELRESAGVRHRCSRPVAADP